MKFTIGMLLTIIASVGVAMLTESLFLSIGIMAIGTVISAIVGKNSFPNPKIKNDKNMLG